MANARKLQAEIDRCLKKVSEGVEKFEETWKKVQNASNNNQKEKYEEDLKKEIKKLQRLRDQIKTWLASGEIKDKSSLMENRKLIETQMERFKIVERETKTKAYSKEGLTNSARMDPAEKEKAEVMNWLNQCIDSLNIQVDQFEAEIESLQGGGKKKKSKSDDAARQDECQMWVEKHRDHIQKLETLLRMLDNGQVETQQIKDIQEDIDNYIENSQEPEFYENEYIYDDISGLDAMLLDIGAPEPQSVEASETASSTNSVSGSSPVLGQTANHNHNHQEDLKRRHRSSQSDDSKVSAKKSGSSSGNLSSSNGGVAGVGSAGPGPAPVSTNTSSSSVSAVSAASPLPAPAPARPVSSGGGGGGGGTPPAKTSGPPQYSLSQSPNNSSPSSGGVTALMAGLTNHLQTETQRQNFAQAAAAPTQNGHPSGDIVTEASLSSSPPHSPSLSTSNFQFCKLETVPGLPTSPVSLPQPGSYPHPGPPAQINGGLVQNLQEHLQHQQKSLPDSLSSLKSLAQQALGQNNPPPAGFMDLGLVQERHKSGGQPMTSLKNEAHIPPLLGVAPLGIVPLNKEHQFQYSMLEAASHHLPHPSDSERLRPYLPRNPCHTPPYYPQAPPQGSDTIDFFQRLSTETLFFIFYYMEGTKAQYLAAKALKKQSWRFHTKYMMWFQRHEEPKMINDEFEQGTYIYFDYEKWGQRKKEGFTFEYRFLEDRDLN